MKRSIALLALVFAALTLGAGPAAAHSSLVSSSPAEGESLSVAPTQVELVFNQDISQSFPTVAITAGSQRVDSGIATVEGARVRTGIDGGPRPGTYTVAYRVVSADGHPITGSYEFVLTGAAVTGTPAATPDTAATTAAAAPGEPTGDAAGPSVVLIAALAVLGVAGVAGLAWALTRSRRDG